MATALTLVARGDRAHTAGRPAGVPGVAQPDLLIAEVCARRPQLIDAWEAAAVIESLGYNDARVFREFGFANTREAGEAVWAGRPNRQPELQPWAPPETESTARILVRSGISTLVYAVPWLSVFIAQTMHPTAMLLPTEVAPAVALALMFSLVVSGGFVQAIVRRGEFYVGNRQLGLARDIVGVLTRIGVSLTVLAALIGMGVGWYFRLAGWPALILGVDVLITMSALWMVCAVFTIRRQQRRVSITFAIGFVAFVAVRRLGADVLSAQLIAAMVLLVVSLAQARALFGDAGARPHRVRLPRSSVVVYATAPYFWYGTAYFLFLFADRLVAGVSAPASEQSPFGIPVPYVAGMELALLTFLLGATGLEIASALLARAMVNEARRPFLGDATAIVAALRRHHTRALAFTVLTFVLAMAGVAVGAWRLLGSALEPVSWSLLLIGDAGYLALAIGLVNALALFQTGRPWAAVRGLSLALAINLTSGFVLSRLYGTSFAAVGLLVGAVCFAVMSTIDVRRALSRGDFSYAVR